MDPIALLALVAVAAFAGLWWVRRRGKDGEGDEGGSRPPRADALDTVAAWPPEATRVLTHQERRAYGLLTQALPDYMVLAQVPVSRFIRVPTRNSYHEWMRRVGQLCADLVICDSASQVIAVVEVRRPPHKDSERTRKRHDRMDRVLRKAGVRVVEWNEEALPHRDAVREQIVPTPKSASTDEATALPGARGPLPGLDGGAAPSAASAPTSRGASAAPTAPRPTTTTRKPATLEDAIEGVDPSGWRGNASPSEPTPSTWFDELESDRVPLDRPKG